MSLTFRKHISKYLELQQHELQSASARGKADGSGHVFATTGAEYVGFMQDTINSARGNWSNYQADFQQSLTDATNELSDSQYTATVQVPKEISALEEKKAQEESLFETKEGRHSADYEKTEEDLRLAKIDHDKIRAELNRPLATKFEKIYIPFLVVLAIAEVPLNRSAFLLYFDGIPSVVLALALAVGGMLVFFAHSIGHLIKEQNGPHSTGGFRPWIGIGSIILVTAILMYFLTVMRQTFTETMKAGTTFDWGEESRIGVFQDSLFQPLNSDGIGLLVLNFSIYFAGVLASFFRHDAHPHYEKIQRNYEKLRAKMATKQERMEKRLNEIQKAHNAELGSLNTRRQNAERDVERLSSDVQDMNTMRINDEKTFLNNLDRLLVAYQNGYREACKQKTMPKFFAKSHLRKLREMVIN